MNQLKGGLTPLPKDERDFQLGALVAYPLLTELPESFSLGAPLTIKDQNADGNEDACTGYGTAGMNEYQENIPLSGAFSFAVGKENDLNKSSWGNDLRSAFKGVQKRGIAEETALSEEDKKLSPQARRDLENWSKPARTNALIHSKKAYVQTKGPYNAFNNIRCALWMYRDEKRAVGFGVKWGWNLSDYILSGTPDGFGHFMYAIGWQGDYLIVVNSAGRNAGRDGIHLVHKDTIEAYIPTYGAYQFIDLTPEEVKAKLEGEVTGLSALIDALLIFLGLKKNEVKPMEPVKEEVKPVETPKKVSLLWDTPENVRHSIRLIGDEFNLPVIWKDLLCDIARCESGFKPNARLENSPKSIDRGLYQWNSYWHPEITDEIAYDPEKNTRLACKALLAGKAVTYWNASKHCWNKGGKYDSIL